MPKGVYARPAAMCFEERRARQLVASRQWKDRNKEQQTAYNISWRSINPEKVKEYSRRERLKHADAYKFRLEKWHKENPWAVHNYSEATRARKLAAFVEAVDRQQVFLNDAGICQWQYCSEPSPFVDPANWHLDHIVALANGGEHSYENTQVTHPVCNLRKGRS